MYYKAIERFTSTRKTPKRRSMADKSAPDKSGFQISALDKFIDNRESGQETDIVFIYDGESKRAAELEDAARACINHYNGRRGIQAGKIVVSGMRDGNPNNDHGK